MQTSADIYAGSGGMMSLLFMTDYLTWRGSQSGERLLLSYLGKILNIRDTFVRKPSKENFYHGILLGILGL